MVILSWLSSNHRDVLRLLFLRNRSLLWILTLFCLDAAGFDEEILVEHVDIYSLD